MWTLTGLLRGILNRPVKIFCVVYFVVYILDIFTFSYDVLFRFYIVRCLNILNFGHRFHFWDRKIFAQYFDHIWPAILYHAWSRAGQRAYDCKCLNEVYKAYRINHILYKKFLVKLIWFKIRQILGGQYCPPPLDLTLIWKLGPDRVKLFHWFRTCLNVWFISWIYALMKSVRF